MASVAVGEEAGTRGLSRGRRGEQWGSAHRRTRRRTRRRSAQRARRAQDLQGAGGALTAASASCFFCRMSVAVLSLCFSNSLTREKHKPHISMVLPLLDLCPANNLCSYCIPSPRTLENISKTVSSKPVCRRPVQLPCVPRWLSPTCSLEWAEHSLPGPLERSPSRQGSQQYGRSEKARATGDAATLLGLLRNTLGMTHDLRYINIPSP